MFYHSIFRINHKKEYARLHGYVKVTRYATSLVKITRGATNPGPAPESASLAS